MRKHLAVLLIAIGCASAAHGIPGLRIDVDGASDDPISETWVTSDPEFDRWLVGDVGAVGTIQGVTLPASYFGLAGTMTLTPSTTALVADPSPSPLPVFLQSGTGSHPVHPDHGIFNDVTLYHWDDFAVGDMSRLDSPVRDYNGSPAWPTSFHDVGIVHVFRVQVSGWWKVHFDAYGTIVRNNGKETTRKTPCSHDGQVPLEPVGWAAVKGLLR